MSVEHELRAATAPPNVLDDDASDLGEWARVVDNLSAGAPAEDPMVARAVAHTQTRPTMLLGGDGQRAPERDPERDPDLDDFLDEPEPEHDWVIPNVVENSERLILTGAEGVGKSELLRQVGVQAGAGVHPFTLGGMDPLRVLLVDLENGRRHVRRKLRTLRNIAGERLRRGQVIPIVEPAGIDLLTRAGVAWLTERIERSHPDLLGIGPLYKLAGGDPTSEEVARKVAATLDDLRDRYAFALILEAHSPHPSAAGRRPIRPYGASLWLRWPEFGLHLSAQDQLLHWRGARDEREWPAALKRGGEWPWTVQTNTRAVTFARILEEVVNARARLSLRELETLTGIPKSTIERAIDANRAQWDQSLEEFDE